jgi:hypothetical protein
MKKKTSIYEFNEIQACSNKSNKLYLSGKFLILINIIFKIMIQAKIFLS